MRIKIISLMLCMLLAFNITGCSSDKKDKSTEDNREEKTTWDEAEDGSDSKIEDDNSGKGKKKTSKERNTGKGSSDKDKKNSRSSKKPDKIKYEYRNHPVEGSYGKDIYALGNYCTIELDEDTREKYPELAAVIDKYNSGAQEEATGFVRGSDSEVMELWEEGFTGYYEEDSYIHPVRADGKVFSFVTEIYSFYGGAHGSTSFTGYNYDPGTGMEISFNDVVKDTDDLPEIIFNELTAQNNDLKDYFDELPTDKENLIKGIPDRLDDNAKGLSWAVDYDGIRINFEDYAMGSYAIGTQSAKIKFEDYPEIFTDRFTDYADVKRIPDIGDIAVKLDDAETVMLGDVSTEKDKKGRDQAGKDSADAGTAYDLPDKPEVNIIKLGKDEQHKMNLFVSNFAEQGFREYDDNYMDVSALAEFAYMWSRINKQSNIETEGYYYRIGFDKIKNIVDKYFGVKLTDNDLYGYTWEKSDNGGFCKGGYYYVPAADGESYTTFAVIEQAEDAGDGVLWLYFTTYNVNMDTYWDNNESIPKKYYSLSSKEAASAPYLTQGYQGLAIVRKAGDSYKLKYYKLY